MMEQEKRRMELEVGRMIIHQKKVERQVFELQYKLSEERRKRKRERKGRKVYYLWGWWCMNGCVITSTRRTNRVTPKL